MSIPGRVLKSKKAHFQFGRNPALSRLEISRSALTGPCTVGRLCKRRRPSRIALASDSLECPAMDAMNITSCKARIRRLASTALPSRRSIRSVFASHWSGTSSNTSRVLTLTTALTLSSSTVALAAMATWQLNTLVFVDAGSGIADALWNELAVKTTIVLHAG